MLPSTSTTLGHDGPAVLALHGGLGWDSATLRPWLDGLADRARLTYVDLLGCGASPEPDDWSAVTDATWAEGVEGVRARLDAERGGHGRAVVFGHSYGAAIALEVARRYPDRVAGLVLCAPPPRPDHLAAAAARAEARLPDLPPETGPALGAALAAPPETDAAFAAAMAALLPLYVADPDAHDLAAFAGRVRFRAGAVRRSFYGLLAEYDPGRRADAVRAPALVLSGRHDWVSPPDEGPAGLAAALGAGHAVFEHSGHFPFMEEPRAFLDVVGRWLDGLAEAPVAAPPRPMTVASSSDGGDRVAEAARTLASPLAFETTAAWGLAAQRAATDAVGADKSAVHWTGVDDFVTETYSPATVARYAGYLPLLQEIGLYERSERLGVLTRRDGYGPHYARMAETEYVREFLPSVDAHDSLTIYVPASPGPAPDPSVQLLIHSSTSGRTFGDRHVETARRLRPAFVAGVAVLRQMARARSDLAALVDACGGACALFSMGGRLLHLSRALGEALGREPRRDALLDRVRGLAADALSSSAKTASAGFAGACGPYRLSASPAVGPRPLLVVAVTAPPPPRSAPSTGEVAERLGLTPRQAEVALLLAERRSNKEIAAALSVSVHTARHHVEAVLGRLDVPRAGVGGVL